MSWEDPTAPRTPWAQRLGHCGPTVATKLRSVGNLAVAAEKSTDRATVGAPSSHLLLSFGKWLLLRRSHARPHSPTAARQIAPPSRGALAPPEVSQPLPSRLQPVDAHTSPHAKEFFLRPPSKLYASTAVATLLGALHAVVNCARLASRALEVEVVAL